MAKKGSGAKGSTKSKAKGRAKSKSKKRQKSKGGPESRGKPKGQSEPKVKKSKKPTRVKSKSKAEGGSRGHSGVKSKPSGSEPTLKGLARALEKLENENERLRGELKGLKALSREQRKTIRSLEGKMDTRVRREEVVMKALGVSSRTKKGENGAIGELNRSILKTEEYILHMGKRIDNILSAIKNHREYLIRLNKKVYKADARKLIEIEVEIINNTLSIMALSGFDINKSIFTDTKKIKKMIAKEDVDLSKIKKSMERLESKFDDEMERFDYESIFRETHDIPGYR